MSLEHRHDPLADGTWEAANVSPTPVVAYAYTGDYRIDCVIEGLAYRWNAGAPLGSPVTVSYSFMNAVPRYGGNEGVDSGGFSPFTPAQKTAVRQIMTKLASELNIRFTEVSDSYSSYGQIRFGNNEQLYSAGYAWVPNAGGDVSGDVWIDSLTPSNMNPTVGSYAYATLVHEIGHALGLKHSGNYNAGTIAQDQPGNYLGTGEDNTNYTIMSYYDPAGGQPRDWFGMYDLLALKKLYGANAAYNAGNTVHAFTNANGQKLSIVDDASGNDTVDVSAVTTGVQFDMRPGTFSSVGKNGFLGAVNNVSIDTATTVENFVGTAQGDTVIGNEAANRFTLGLGTNSADGNGGIDFAVYAGSRSAYTATASGSTVTVTGSGLRDTLVDVERLQFGNAKVAFDLSGHAGETAKALGVVLGASAVNNASLAGSGLHLLDTGISYAGVLDIALDYVLGNNATHRAVVDLMFANVAGRAPTAAEAGYYTGLIADGTYTQASLAVMAAETGENAANIDLVGLAREGLLYA
jgi:serralysin